MIYKSNQKKVHQTKIKNLKFSLVKLSKLGISNSGEFWKESLDLKLINVDK